MLARIDYDGTESAVALWCGSCSDKLRKRPCGSSGESLEAALLRLRRIEIL